MAPSGFVYVIESPSDADLLDGRTEGRSLCEVLHLAEIPRWYSLVTSKATLQESLGARINQAYLTLDKKAPILHLSMHGNNQGIALTNGEFLSWDELRQQLTHLSNFMQGGLLICMSTCYGSSACMMAMDHGTNHPFWALVSHNGKAQWADSAIAYITFYHHLFRGTPIQKCVELMRAASGDNGFNVQSGAKVKQDWIGLVQSLQSVNAALGQLGQPQPGPVAGPASSPLANYGQHDV